MEQSNCDIGYLRCPECKSKQIVDVEDRGDRVCSHCGFVLGEVFVESTYTIVGQGSGKWFRPSQYTYPGNAMTDALHLGSIIGYPKEKFAFVDCKNQEISPNNKALFMKLKKLDLMGKLKHKETLSRTLLILKDIAAMLALTPIVAQRAAYLYHRVVKAENGEIPNHVTLLAGCIALATRGEGRNAPVSLAELARAFQQRGHYVTDRLVLRACIAYKKHARAGRTARRSEEYLERMLSLVIQYPGLSRRVEKKAHVPFPQYVQSLQATARDLLADFPLRERRGLNPYILAAAIVYAADRVMAKERATPGVLTQEIMSAATGVAEYSIRDHFVSVLKSRFLVGARDMGQEEDGIVVKEGPG